MGEDGSGGVLPFPRVDRAAVVSIACEHLELIDEFYCQLVKQTSGNPNITSEVRGWRLLAAGAAEFLPGSELRECVSRHADGSRWRPDGVGGLAFFVYQRCARGVGGGPASTTPLGAADVSDIESCHVPPSVYGASLEGTLRKELFAANPRAAMPPPGFLLEGANVPEVVRGLVRAVTELGGGECEDVFRCGDGVRGGDGFRVAGEGRDFTRDVEFFRDEIRGGDYRALNVGGASTSPPLDPTFANIRLTRATSLNLNNIFGRRNPSLPPKNLGNGCTKKPRKNVDLAVISFPC